MNRRDFLKTTIITGITFAMPGNTNLFIKALEAAEKIDLVVTHGISPARITKAAIDGLGGIRAFISRGDIVVVKPNIGWIDCPNMRQLQIRKWYQLLFLCVMRRGQSKLRFLIIMF